MIITRKEKQRLITLKNLLSTTSNQLHLQSEVVVMGFLTELQQLLHSPRTFKATMIFGNVVHDLKSAHPSENVRQFAEALTIEWTKMLYHEQAKKVTSTVAAKSRGRQEAHPTTTEINSLSLKKATTTITGGGKGCIPVQELKAPTSPINGDQMAPRNLSSGLSQQEEVEVMDFLLKLQQLLFTKHTLKVTMIGKTVDRLRRMHPSNKVRELAQTIITEWMRMLYEQVKKPTTTTIVTAQDEKGYISLPAPKTPESFINEHALDNQTLSTSLSPLVNSKNTDKSKNEMKLQKEYFFSAIPKSYASYKQEKQSDDLLKFQASKRKLHESYGNAKKRRTTKFIDFYDLPKNNFTQAPKVLGKRPQAYQKLSLYKSR